MKTNTFSFNMKFCLSMFLLLLTLVIGGVDSSFAANSVKKKYSKKLKKQERSIKKAYRSGTVTESEYDSLMKRQGVAKERVKALPSDRPGSKRKIRRAKQALVNTSSAIYVERLDRDSNKSPEEMQRVRVRSDRKELRNRVRAQADGSVSDNEARAMKNQAERLKRVRQRAQADGMVDEGELKRILQEKKYRKQLINWANRSDRPNAKKPTRARH